MAKKKHPQPSTKTAVGKAQGIAKVDMRVISVSTDPNQVDRLVQWYALDPAHGSYAATLSLLAASASNVPAGYGTYAVVSGGNGYTGLNIVGPTYGNFGLTISASGVCRDIFNYTCSYNPNYAAPSSRTNAWGDTYSICGQFLSTPQRLTTNGEDRRLANAKGLGTDTILYIAQTARGSGNGSTYLDACSVHDCLSYDHLSNSSKHPENYDILVLCGALSRLRNDGVNVNTNSVGIEIKTGTSGAHTAVLSHPTDRAYVYYGRKLGAGNASPTTSLGEDGSWTDQGDGTWRIDVGTSALWSDFSLNPKYSFTNQGGTHRPLVHAYTLSECVAKPEGSYFNPIFRTGARNATRTYVAGDRIRSKNFNYLCVTSHTNQAPPDPVGPCDAITPNANTYWTQEPYNGPAGINLWNSGYGYTVGCVVYSGGVWYVCIANNTNQVPPNASYWAPEIALATWDSGTTYAKGEVALSGGTYYTSKQSHSNHVPPNATYWETQHHIYVNNGGDPKDNTFFTEALTTIGIQLYLDQTDYVDLYGLTVSGGLIQTYCDHITWYACKFWDASFGAQNANVNEATGAFSATPDTSNGRSWIGCEWTHCGAAIYDTNGGHLLVCTNTLFQDCYIHDNGKFDETYNVNKSSTSDAHAIANQGCDGWLVVNCRFDTMGGQTIVPYMQGNSYATPTGGLELTTGYVDGFGWPNAVEESAGIFNCPGKCKNFVIRGNLFTNPLTGAVHAVYDGETYGSMLNGDLPLLNVNGNYNGCIFEDNRYEGSWNNGYLRLKFPFYDADTEKPIVRRNVGRGGAIGIYTFTAHTVLTGTYDASVIAYQNDFQVELNPPGASFPIFILLGNTANIHEHNLHNNTYRSGYGAKWRGFGGDYTTLATWQAAAPAGDDYDTNSVHTPL